MTRQTLIAAAVASVLMSSPLAVMAAEPNEGNEWAPMLELFMQHDVTKWATDPRLIDALRAQNERTAALSQADIDALDEAWIGGNPSDPLIADVLNSPVADFLRMEVEAFYGAVTEIILMDARGLNVAISHLTSDYWQGDEAKYQETFSKGTGTIFVDGMEVDASTGQYQGQVSMTISDPETGAPLGALTLGVIPEML